MWGVCLPPAPQQHCWVSKRNPQHKIEVGTEVYFRVAE